MPQSNIKAFLNAVESSFSQTEVEILQEIDDVWKKATLPWDSKPLAVLSPAQPSSHPSDCVDPEKSCK